MKIKQLNLLIMAVNSETMNITFHQCLFMFTYLKDTTRGSCDIFYEEGKV